MRSNHSCARIGIAMVLVAVSFGSVACSPASGAGNESSKAAAPFRESKATAPANTETNSTPTVTAATVAPPKMTAKQVADKRCKGCHSVSKALNYKAPTTASAQAVIQRMERRGASLSADETAIIIAYYTR